HPSLRIEQEGVFLGRNLAQYTFLLDPEGRVIADALLYRVDAERYMLTTSPMRAARVESWLTQLLTGQSAVDLEVPERRLPSRLTLRRLDNAPGRDGTVVLGLAGPSAAAVLRTLADGADDRRAIARLRRFTLTSARLAGHSCTVARTGHT